MMWLLCGQLCARSCRGSENKEADAPRGVCGVDDSHTETNKQDKYHEEAKRKEMHEGMTEGLAMYEE